MRRIHTQRDSVTPNVTIPSLANRRQVKKLLHVILNVFQFSNLTSNDAERTLSQSPVAQPPGDGWEQEGRGEEEREERDGKGGEGTGPPIFQNVAAPLTEPMIPLEPLSSSPCSSFPSSTDPILFTHYQPKCRTTNSIKNKMLSYR